MGRRIKTKYHIRGIGDVVHRRGMVITDLGDAVDLSVEVPGGYRGLMTLSKSEAGDFPTETTYEKERLLVALFRQLSPECQDIAIDFLRELLEVQDET